MTFPWRAHRSGASSPWRWLWLWQWLWRSLPIGLSFGLAAAWLPALADPLDDAVVGLQHEWEVVRYQTPTSERAKRYEQLAATAQRVSEAFPQRAEPLAWEATVLASWAEEKGWFAGWGLARRARTLYEAALQIDGQVLDGAACAQLGVLYQKVPGWPFGFGDPSLARDYLRRALAVNAAGIEANASYGEYLLELDQPGEAVAYLRRAAEAAPRPGHVVGDTARREQARQLLERAREKLRSASGASSSPPRPAG